MKGKILVCALAVSATALFAQESVLKNPGFEEGETGWGLRNRAENATTTITKEAARRGEAGVRIDDQSKDEAAGIMSEKIPVKPGQKVRVQFWARAKSEKFANVRIIWFFEDKKWVSDEQFPSVAIRNSGWKWYRDKVEAVIPKHASFIAIGAGTWRESTGMVDLDEFELDIR